MSAREVFSEQELARLRGFPEISRTELVRFFTLTTADEAFVRSMRRATIVLGAAVQLCTRRGCDRTGRVSRPGDLHQVRPGSDSQWRGWDGCQRGGPIIPRTATRF